MDREHAGSEHSIPGGVLRGVVGLLGVGALGAAAFVLVGVGAVLQRDPRTPAEAHAMAHSLPVVIVWGVFGIGGFGLAGICLLAVAYANRRRLSAVTLVLAGVALLGALGDRSVDPVAVVPLAVATLGGYALYDVASSRGFGAFVAATTALLWLVEYLRLTAYLLGFPWLVSSFVPYAATVWLGWLLDAGALGILAVAARNRHAGVPVPRAPVALAAAILLSYLPGAVWAALSGYVVAGLDPLGWATVLLATVAAVAILTGRSAKL